MGLFSRLRTDRTIVIVIAGMMVAAGLVLSLMSLRSINYVQTEGVVIESGLERARRGPRRQGFRSVNRTVAHIRYVYSVNDVRYDNDTVSYRVNPFRSKQGLLNLYPAGKRVLVYYSITDPGYSVLEKGFSFGALGLFTAGVLLFVGLRFVRT